MNKLTASIMAGGIESIMNGGAASSMSGGIASMMNVRDCINNEGEGLNQ